jgi:hypothetical protein
MIGPEVESVDATRMDWGGVGTALQTSASDRHQVKSMSRNRIPFRTFRSVEDLDLYLEQLGMVGVGLFF